MTASEQPGGGSVFRRPVGAPSKPAASPRPTTQPGSAGRPKTTNGGRDLYCPHCGTVTAPQVIARGSFVVELLLWLVCVPLGLFMFPFGLILLLAPVGYTVSRLSRPHKVCPKCQQSAMIPLDSPKAKAALMSEGKETR